MCPLRLLTMSNSAARAPSRSSRRPPIPKTSPIARRNSAIPRWRSGMSAASMASPAFTARRALRGSGPSSVHRSSSPTRMRPAPLLLLVETQRGYANLCRILTESHRRVAKGESLNRWEEIEECAEGLTALARGDASLRTSVLDRANAIFGRDRLWVDVSRHLDRATEAAGRRAVALAEAARVPVVATNDVRHARPEGASSSTR